MGPLIRVLLAGLATIAKTIGLIGIGALVSVMVYQFNAFVARLLPHLPFRPRVRLSKEPIPQSWSSILERNVPISQRLGAAQRKYLLRLVQVFLRDTPIEGCGGLQLSEEISVTIAAQACILLLNDPYPMYPKLRRVLVYPSVFRPGSGQSLPKDWPRERLPTLGQAWRDGVVVLSWDSALVGSLNPFDGRNVVMHEFAHVLDVEDGVFDGTPYLAHATAYRSWAFAMKREFERHVRRVRKGSKTKLREYGAKNRAEFFAVATEAFFERPDQLRRTRPAVYDVLRDFYRQDPAAWPQPAVGGAA